MKKYTSFILFLLDTPRNLLSVILIWGMAIAGMVVSHQTREDFDPGVYEGVIIFLLAIMFIGWLRVYLLYKRNS